jgi:hypothetical protein
MTGKIINLKSSLAKKTILLPIGIFIILLTFNIFEKRGEIDSIVLVYSLVALVFILLSFEKEFFGSQRYLKISDNALIYKRFPLSPKITIYISFIDKIIIRGLKIYIYTSSGDIHLVNTEWLTRNSQKELLEFFRKEFNDKLEEVKQKDFFTERYERKMKKLRKEGKI